MKLNIVKIKERFNYAEIKEHVKYAVVGAIFLAPYFLHDLKLAEKVNHYHDMGRIDFDNLDMSIPFVTARELSEDWQKDPQKTRNKYKDRIIQVAGRVTFFTTHNDARTYHSRKPDFEIVELTGKRVHRFTYMPTPDSSSEYYPENMDTKEKVARRMLGEGTIICLLKSTPNIYGQLSLLSRQRNIIIRGEFDFIPNDIYYRDTSNKDMSIANQRLLFTFENMQNVYFSRKEHGKIFLNNCIIVIIDRD